MISQSSKENAQNSIMLSIDSILLSLDALSDIEINSIMTDREERGGVLCFNPNTKKSEIKKVDGTNDSAVNSPSLTIGQIGKLCPKKDITTYWHTHGTALRSFSDMDRYSAGDMAASGNRIGLCSIAIDGIQCHYAFTAVPEVVNIQWNGKLKEGLKKNAKKTYIIDDLLCDSELSCRARIWSEGMSKKMIGRYDQINALQGTESWVDANGTVVASQSSLECYEIESEDGFVSLNCYGREGEEYHKGT